MKIQLVSRIVIDAQYSLHPGRFCFSAKAIPYDPDSNLPGRVDVPHVLSLFDGERKAKLQAAIDRALEKGGAHPVGGVLQQVAGRGTTILVPTVDGGKKRLERTRQHVGSAFPETIPGAPAEV